MAIIRQVYSFSRLARWSSLGVVGPTKAFLIHDTTELDDRVLDLLFVVPVLSVEDAEGECEGRRDDDGGAGCFVEAIVCGTGVGRRLKALAYFSCKKSFEVLCAIVGRRKPE